MNTYTISVSQDGSPRIHKWKVLASSSNFAALLAFALDGGWGTTERDASEMLALAKTYCSIEYFGSTEDRTQEMEDLLRSAHAIAIRQGEGTHWKRFAASIQELGIGPVTARTYRILKDEDPL